MQLDELDRLLKQWRADVDAAQNNLYDLQKKLTFKLLSGDPVTNQPPMKLNGQSQVKVTEALAAIQTVDVYLPLLDKTIHLAQTKRDTEMPRFMQGGKIQEIAVILTSESIELPAVSVPEAERGLLSSSTVSKHASPQTLLDLSVDAFKRGQSVIVQVEQVWHSSKDKLDAAWVELKQLEQKVNALGSEAARNELATASDALQNWQNSWESDPLGVGQGLDCLDKLKQRLGGFEQDKKTATGELEQARATMARLKLLPNMDASRVASLENSLHGIEGAFNKGDYPLVRTLLDAWRKAAVDLETRKSTQSSTTPPKYTPGTTQPANPDPRVSVVVHPPLVREKSDLEKLVEGETPIPPPPPTKVEQPKNEELEKLLEKGGPATPPPADQKKPSSALTDLIEGTGKPAPPAPPATQTKPAGTVDPTLLDPKPAAKPGTMTPQPPAAKPADPLADLINGGSSGSSSAPHQPAPPATKPAPSTPPAKPDSGLGDLIEGKAKPPAPPSTPKPPQTTPSAANGSLADLIEGGNQGATKQNPKQAPAGKPGNEKAGGASGPKGSLGDLFK